MRERVLMPFKRERYPAEWEAISLRIRNERAENRCECEGECGLHPGARCVEMNGEPAQFARGKIMLTVAHLDHTPQNCDEANLKAMCQRCHCRYDSEHHQINARRTRTLKRLAKNPCLDFDDLPMP